MLNRRDLLAALAIGVMATQGVEAYAQGHAPIWPKGVTTSRFVQSWEFSCAQASDYQVEVLNGNTSIVRSAAFRAAPVKGKCRAALSQLDSWRLTQSHLELEQTYRWRVWKNGVASPAAEFKLIPILDADFSSMPKSAAPSSDSWRTEGGKLVIGKARAADWVTFDDSLKGDKKIFDAQDIEARIASICPEARCEFALRFNVDHPSCSSPTSCKHVSWKELFIAKDGRVSIRNMWDGKPTHVFHEFGDTWFLDLSTPRTVRLTQLKGRLLITVDGAERVCVLVPGMSFHSWSRAGFSWSSDEDDENVARLEVDYLRVAATAPDPPGRCHSPIPTL
jgi:hypothetical protein